MATAPKHPTRRRAGPDQPSSLVVPWRVLGRVDVPWLLARGLVVLHGMLRGVVFLVLLAIRILAHPHNISTPHTPAPRATVRAKAQLTLPPEIRDALRVREGDEVEFTITEAGEVLLRGMTSMPTDQRWFWEPEWQAGEREASEQIKAGDVEIFDDAEAMFASLDKLGK